MKKAAFYTLGCKVNQYETQSMIERFSKAGYEVVDFDQPADVYVINTCTVTNFGDRKSRQIIRRARRNNPEAIIAVTGCYSQVSPEEVEGIEGVDIITGTGDRSAVLELVDSVGKRRRIRRVGNVMGLREFEDTGCISFNERTRAFIKIQEGCDNFCSYCIIPYARGPVRSRKKENIIQEVNLLAANGFKEVVLTGIHLTSYGKDLDNVSLIEVIEEINRIPAIRRIRLGSLEPNFITHELVNKMRSFEKLCPHFHISLQSGSDTVLRRMNRKYTPGEYRGIIEIIRESFPDVSITTDVMVGFPGETPKEFQETYDFLNRISLTKLHVFKYSPRKGTPAASFPGQIDAGTKEERSNLLLELSDKKQLEFNSKFLGRTMEVLFEQESDYGKGYLEGHTENFIRVAASIEKGYLGESKQIRLVNIEENGLVTGDV